MKTVLALALAAIVTSCAPVSNTVTPAAETINKKWELISLEGNEIMTSKPVFLDFDANNKITGFAGCNTFNGNYMVKNGTQINFSQVANTMMMCEPFDMNVEKGLMDVLKTADNFTLNNGQLMLNVGRRAPLAVFAEMSKDPALNTYWSLKELNGKKVMMVANQEKEQGFMLRSGGKMTGFAGCNSFSGNYTLSGKNTIKFNSNIAMTTKACTDVKLNEQTFVNIFKTANNYQVKDNTLILKDAANKVFAVFEKM